MVEINNLMPIKGDRHIKILAAFWNVVCPYHRGEAIIATENRIDPNTGHPRTLPVINPISGEITKENVEFPIYSESTGFDSSCDECQRTLIETQQHIRIVELDRIQADYEFGLEFRRRGLSDK